MNSEMISLYRMAKTTHSMLYSIWLLENVENGGEHKIILKIMKHIMKIFSYPIVG